MLKWYLLCFSTWISLISYKSWYVIKKRSRAYKNSVTECTTIYIVIVDCNTAQNRDYVVIYIRQSKQRIISSLYCGSWAGQRYGRKRVLTLIVQLSSLSDQHSWERNEPPYHVRHMLNSTTSNLLQKWLWYLIKKERWYGIGQTKPNQTKHFFNNLILFFLCQLYSKKYRLEIKYYCESEEFFFFCRKENLFLPLFIMRYFDFSFLSFFFSLLWKNN